MLAQYGRRLALTVDLRQGGAWERLQQAMAGFRPGGTPLRLDLIAGDSRGVVDLNGPNSVRTDAELITALRALPGITQVSLTMHRPWASDR
jgi:DNA polymerase-3 subunit alpha